MKYNKIGSTWGKQKLFMSFSLFFISQNYFKIKNKELRQMYTGLNS